MVVLAAAHLTAGARLSCTRRGHTNTPHQLLRVVDQLVELDVEVVGGMDELAGGACAGDQNSTGCLPCPPDRLCAELRLPECTRRPPTGCARFHLPQSFFASNLPHCSFTALLVLHNLHNLQASKDKKLEGYEAFMVYVDVLLAQVRRKRS